MRAIRNVVVRSFGRSFAGDGLQLAAALSYYALLSMTPTLLIAVSLAGLFVEDGRVRTELIAQMRALVGDEGAQLVRTVLENLDTRSRGLGSLIAGGALTLAGAASFFAQLQHALNRVWRVEAAPTPAFLGRFVRHRVLSFMLVLAVGFLLLVSLVISALLASLHRLLDERLASAALAWRMLDLGVSFGLATVLIALMFRYLPDAAIAWRDAWTGGATTAALFLVGKQIIGLYIGGAAVTSSFGAAGSAVVFLMWVYYASLILLFGATVTRAMAEERGEPAAPDVDAHRARREDT